MNKKKSNNLKIEDKPILEDRDKYAKEYQKFLKENYKKE